MHSALDPASPQARAIAHLWWWMLGAGALVWVAVIATMLYATFARRTRRGADGLQALAPAQHGRLERIVAGATFTTVLILAAFLVFDFTAGHALAEHPQRALTIDVTGQQWWWLARYEDPDPSKSVTTANEIHVPVGEMVQLKLRSADVIHSFWAPNLQGKRDLIPGYTSTHWFRADTAGVYRGQCAEFCGMQHAKMAFYIIAEPIPRFQAWLAAARQPHQEPTDSLLRYGYRVFMSSGCALCHSIAGTEARGTIGPGLSHFKSRMSIAAGTLANNRANVMSWIANPQAFKPGARMPSYPLTASQLDALVSYLETLK